MTLLNMGAEIDSKDNNWRTPLMWSVKRNHVRCAEILLDYKASVDLQDADGDSALHMACGQGHAAIANLLLDRGASLTLQNKRGHDCLEVAAKAGSTDVAVTIVKHKRLVAVQKKTPKKHRLSRCRFPRRKRSMPFLAVDAIIGNQAIRRNSSSFICSSLVLD